MASTTQAIQSNNDFTRLLASYRTAKDFENSLFSTNPVEEKRLDAAVDETSAAFVAMLGFETIEPAHLADKLTAVVEHYDVFCCGIDRDVGNKLFADVVDALKLKQVRA